jgi:hypothetical protein
MILNQECYKAKRVRLCSKVVILSNTAVFHFALNITCAVSSTNTVSFIVQEIINIFLRLYTKCEDRHNENVAET